MWPLLARFWKPLAGAALIIGAGLYIHHAGYQSGHAASEAHWKQRFVVAERERDAANARAEKKEADSRALYDQTEKQHGETIASLNLRAADADKRIRTLSLRVAAASSRLCEVPTASGAASVSDAAATSTERAERAGAIISDTGRRCELDAATVVEWQRYYSGLRRIHQEP